MKSTLLIICLMLFELGFSQNRNCVDQIQLETYQFATTNLEKINDDIYDKNSVIEVTIEIENNKVKLIKYNLISPENNYSGENKSEIKVWKGLNNFILKTVNHNLKNCFTFTYTGIIYKVPLSMENIQNAINEVNPEINRNKQK